MLFNTYNKIISRARQGLGWSIRTLSDKVGVKPHDVVMIEEGRDPCQSIIAETLGLSFNKLEKIYQNKYMEPKIKEKIGKDLTLKKYEVEVGGVVANTYVLVKGKSKEDYLFVDAVGASDQAIRLVESNMPHALLITHGHFDHRAGQEIVKQKFTDIKIIEAGKDIKTDGPIDISGFNVKAIRTPGHTEDSVCYLVDEQILFTGDTIFAGSIGKPNYDYQILLKSIKEKVFSLPESVIIAPGHGPLTTVAHEKVHNPFF